MPITKQDTIGSIVFRYEGDGCITAKYHHRDTIQGPFAECSKFISKGGRRFNKFVGHYTTTWIEEGHFIDNCNLEVVARGNVFDLIWYDASNPANHFFEGTAMLHGDLLVGAYWQV